MSIFVIGHKSPDTDTVVSAIALADYLSKTGKEAKAAVPAAINPESAFVLNKFGLATPEILADAAGQKLFLVDTSDKAQIIDNLDKAEILGIVDHHKLGDVTTPAPLTMHVMPVGCTCTVIKWLYDNAGVEIPKAIAGAMMCAILSDTVIFKSPTCTEMDKAAVAGLAAIAGVADTTALGIEMFKVKSAVDGTPIKDLLFRDYKDFNMGGKKVGIAQLEVVDLSILEPVKAALYEEMKAVKADGRHSVFLLLTDIMKEGSEMLIVSDDPSYVEKAFGKKPEGISVWLDGVLSRKKQVVPPDRKSVV